MHQFRYFTFLGAFFLWSCQDACQELNCQNDASCHEGECVCLKWYSGDECQLFYNRNYEGEYLGSYRNGGRAEVVQLFIEADTEVPNRMTLPSGLYLEFVDETALVIPIQQVLEDGDTLLIEGNGSYTELEIEFSYNKTLQSDANNLAEIKTIRFEGQRVE